PPQFARILALSVLNQFFGVKFPFELVYLEDNEKLSFRALKSEKTHHYFKIATTAIDKLKMLPKREIANKIYQVELTNNFKIQNNSKSEVEINFCASAKRWVFELDRNKNEQELYRIELRRFNNSPLFDSVHEVHLISKSNVLRDYTILWKVFEH